MRRGYGSVMPTSAIRGDRDAAATRLMRAARKRAVLLDFALASVLATVVVFAAATGASGQPAIGTAVLAVGALALGWRRRYPGAVLAVAVSAYLADHLLTRHTGPGLPAVLIALYTLAAHKGRQPALWGLLAAAGAVLVGESVHGAQRASGVAVSVVALVASSLIGVSVAERRREQQREQRLLADNAAADERVRIARELHDVVAHHLSVMVVQANVVAEAMPADEIAQLSVQAIVDSGRRALAEMRRILDVLRAHEDDGARPRSPQPGLAQLGALVHSVRLAGLQVEVRIEGSERPLPEALDLSAYRIAQEALTNVLRHAHARSASVRITYTSRAVELQVTDDGVGTSSDEAQGWGHGLSGMRERALLLGGEFSSGPANGRGFSVRAVLPL